VTALKKKIKTIVIFLAGGGFKYFKKQTPPQITPRTTSPPFGGTHPREGNFLAVEMFRQRSLTLVPLNMTREARGGLHKYNAESF
ncbi:MAG: hypothetical protein LBL66_06005, partial [Clostridiales bacterium]|nr:hypothetical protein [Clostridiales bacterium]